MWSAFHHERLLGKKMTTDFTGGASGGESQLKGAAFFSEENQHTEHVLAFQKHVGP